MSRETVACTASMPSLAQRLGELGLRREVAAARRGGRIAPWRSYFVVMRSTSRRSSIARSASSAEIVSGGVIRSAVSPAVPTSRPCSSAARATGTRRAAELDREQEAGAAHAVEGGFEPRADLAHVREQLVVDRVDDGAGGRARDRVAAEGRGVVAGDEAARRAVGDEQRADRQAVREALRERDRVGADAGALPGEELAGAADAGLHLVEDEQSRSCSSASARASLERLGGERPHAALALHRLEEDRGGVGADRLGERLGRREANARDERLERRALRRLAGDRERAHRPAVERAFERDEPGAPGRLARPLDRGLDRLGAGVAEEGVRAAEALGQLRRRARSIGSVE